MELWRKMLYLRESVSFRWNTADVNKPIMLRYISKLITLCREFMGLSLWRAPQSAATWIPQLKSCCGYVERKE